MSKRPIWHSVRLQSAVLVAAMALFLGGGLFAVDRVTDSIDELIVGTTRARLQGVAAQAVLVALQESETGQRGYLLTGRVSYLKPYYNTIGRIDELLAVLGGRVAGDADQMAQYDILAAAAREKVAELRETVVTAQRDGLSAAGQIVLTDAGNAYMEQAHLAAERMIQRAEAERSLRARTLQRRQETVTEILIGALAGSVLLLGVAALVLVWNLGRLRRARAGELLEAAQLQAAIESGPAGIGVFNAAGRLTLSNRNFAPVLAVLPELAQPGAPLTAIAEAAAFEPPLAAAPIARAPLATEVRQGNRTLEVWRGPMPDGGELLAVADVTRRVQAEEVARQAQKMDVLGQMTGGVAHDFNNLLQIVSANLELVRSKLVRNGAQDNGLLARLDAASAGVARGARLTRHLLAFARRQPLAPEAIDPARLLMGLEDVLRRTLGEGVKLELIVGGGLWAMRADPTQFENALLNLTLNARDAMVGPDGIPTGQLTIEAANAALDESYAARSADVTPGQYVMFAVTDTGGGMSAEQVARAVEPFYTTKAEGRGTGLGLPMVLGFAKQSGGHFQLYSEPNRGTTARLYIPRTNAAAARPEPALPEVPAGRGELVLLVEDDAAVRQTARAALNGLGYDVIEADSADAAMQMLEDGARPRVLFTDVVMPGRISARAMADRARALLPGLAVLFTSGYTQNSIVHNGQLDHDVTLLSKPWRTEQLARALHSVLTGGGLRPKPRRRVLLVEDEELVRMTTADALAELGFDVIEAGTGAAALTRLAPAPDLMLTDLGLPDQDGAVLVTEVRRRLPDLPIVVVSGQSEAPMDGVVWLGKPYDINGLRRAIEEALGG